MRESDAHGGSPFVGPRPFLEAEENLFFGRVREVADLRGLIAAHRIVLIYAPSGAGKSSLINAGLIPELKRDGFEVLPIALVGGRVPTGGALRSGNVFVDNVMVSWLSAEAKGFPETTIGRFLAAQEHQTDADGFAQPRLLVFDQFEELFTTHPEHWEARAEFLRQLRDALDEDPLLRVVFAMREEYMAKFDSLVGIFANQLPFRFRLELLREGAAVDAVREPLETVGKTVAPAVAKGLVDRLLEMRIETESGETRTVRGQFVEPVQLQVVCQRLWSELPPDVASITKEQVSRLGPLHEILSRFYEEGIRCAAARTGVSEKRLRHAFEAEFVTTAGTRGFVHREKSATAGIPSVAVALLEDRRLLRSEWRAGAQWYEIPHDSLVEPIRRANAAWRRRRQDRRNHVLATVVCIVLAGLGLTITMLSLFQPASEEVGRFEGGIGVVRVVSYAPLEVVAEFTNASPYDLFDVSGVATLRGQDGRSIDSFGTETFSVGAGEMASVRAKSLWAALDAGSYTIEFLLDLGEFGSLAASRAFEIVSVVSPPFPPPPEDLRIEAMDVVSVVPLVVSFSVAFRGGERPEYLDGTVSITDRFGAVLARVPVQRFSIPRENVASVELPIGLAFLEVGFYVLDVGLKTNTGEPLGESLAFRVLPIRLPLETEFLDDGEGLYTVYQEPLNWGLGRIGVPDAWSFSHGDGSVVVAVVDSGIDSSIPQLADGMWINSGEIPGNGLDDDENGYVDDVNGWDFRDGDSSSLTGTPIHWHGTFVAGVIAARPGQYPIVGVAPGVRLMDVRFLDSDNSFRASDWTTFAEAIDYAADNGADIINLGIYANGTPPAVFADALRRAFGKGTVIVGIAGNMGEREVLYPGKYPEVCAVAATTSDDLLAAFSNTGPEVEVCAPGERIASLVAGGDVAERSGTSVGSAPLVTGTLALILSVAPELSPAEAIAVLKRAAVDLGPPGADELFGHGLVNADRALSSLTADRP